MTRFGFLDGCQHSRRRKSGSNCVGFNLPTRHEIFILMSPTTHKILFIKKPTTHVKKIKLLPDPPNTFNSGTALIIKQQ